VQRSQWAAYVALPVLLSLLLFVGVRHEPWADEGQAWLLARDNSLATLLTHAVRYEGSPGLWHALLWLLERAGFPYRGLWLISSAFAGAGAAIVLLRAPFPLWLRIGCTFSYFFAYQYAIIARSYAFDLVLIPLLAALFQDRLKRPIVYCGALGLCANCNAFSFIISGALFCELALAARRSQSWRDSCVLIGGAIFVLFGLAAIVQAWPPSDESYDIGPWTYRWIRPILQLAYAFVDSADILGSTKPGLPSRLCGAALSLIFLFPSLLLFRRARTLALFAGMTLPLAVFCVVEYANAWHSGIIYLAWIFVLWISWHAIDALSPRKRASVFASVALLSLLQVGDTFAAWIRDVEAPYSSGSAVAAELARFRQSHPDAVIAAMGFKAFSVQPWFSANVFANYNSGASKPSYYVWRKSDRFPVKPDLRMWTDMVSAKRTDVLVLSTFRILNVDEYIRAATAQGYCVSKEVPGGMIWRTYVLEDDRVIIFKRRAASLADCDVDEIAAFQ
jgi:hypothetical protein